MNPSSVVGCSTCGALYTPAAGDDGVCPTCSSILPVEQPPKPARPTGPSLRSVSRPASQSFDVDLDDAPRPRKRGSRRSLRPIVIGVVGALLAAGIAAVIVTKPRPVMQAWSSIRRHSPMEAWTAVQRFAWIPVQRFALSTWVTVKHHLPFDWAQDEKSVPASPKRDATASHGTHRRSHGKGKHGGDD
jgi:hypothetical protein